MKKIIFIIVIVALGASGYFAFKKYHGSKTSSPELAVTHQEQNLADIISQQPIGTSTRPGFLPATIPLEGSNSDVLENVNILSDGTNKIGGERTFYTQSKLPNLYITYQKWFKENGWTPLEQTQGNDVALLSGQKQDVVLVVSMKKDPSTNKNIVSVRASQVQINTFR